MFRFVSLILLAGCAGLGATVAAASYAAAPTMAVSLEGLGRGQRLPPSAAFCAPPSSAPETYNVSPAVSWSKGPRGTRSYALIMTDLDVPKDLGASGRRGAMIAADAPRIPFIHWVLIDIPPSITHLTRGQESAGFAPGPRPLGLTDHGRRGANVYSNYYPKGSPLAGPRGGYDGPCPPNNDPKPHRYVTQVYALDVAKLGLSGVFFGESALRRMSGHVLASGSTTALYGGDGTGH
ncbi:MAG TPA: YbhB/YbcL family Raf kinase inhibitor-like protein [Caulobacteraceae bacterium]|nr:YbhB/YbcL family Raf kinase inhibitor-like protein [Caulobacteraceae bacterium]